MTLKIRRGTDAQRLTVTPEEGEPIWTTDTDKFYVGDGTTVGGIEVSDAENLPALPSTEDIYVLNVDGSGDGTWIADSNPNVPNAPTNTASLVRYELVVPATSGAANWQVASGGTSSSIAGVFQSSGGTNTSAGTWSKVNSNTAFFSFNSNPTVITQELAFTNTQFSLAASTGIVTFAQAGFYSIGVKEMGVDGSITRTDSNSSSISISQSQTNAGFNVVHTSSSTPVNAISGIGQRAAATISIAAGATTAFTADTTRLISEEELIQVAVGDTLQLQMNFGFTLTTAQGAGTVSLRPQGKFFFHRVG